jgi:tetratricopeptide (TPR) repeat protein
MNIEVEAARRKGICSGKYVAFCSAISQHSDLMMKRASGKAIRSQIVECVGFAFAILLTALACSNPQAQRVEILELHASGRYAETIEPLEALLDHTPDDSELNHLYGVALLATGNTALAVWPLRKAAEDPQRAVEDGLLLARAQLVGGSANDAIATADRILEQAPDLPEALLLRAEAKLAEKRSEEALDDIERVLVQQPDEPAALLARVKALLVLERDEEAAEALAAVRDITPENEDQAAWQARFCAAGAVFADEKGDVEIAQAEWVQCLERHPSEPVVVEESVRFFDQRGEYERAAGILRRALGERPEYTPYRTQLAQRLEFAGRSIEAEQTLVEGAEGSGGADAWIALAEYYNQREELSKARSAMEHLMAEVPNLPMVYRSFYVDLLIRVGDPAAAEAIETVDSPAVSQLLRGRLHLEQGDPHRALELLDEGIRLWPDNSVARQLAAEAAEKLGDFDRAIAEYWEAVRNDFSNWEALSRLAVLHEAQGTGEEILPMLRQYVQKNPGDLSGHRLTIQVARQHGLHSVVAHALQMLRRLPGREGVALAEAAIDRGAGDPIAAVELIEASSLDLTQPMNAEALAVLVDKLSLLERHAEAIRRADAAVAAYPNFAGFHELRGRALLATGNKPSEAREALSRAQELDPGRASVLVALAELAASVGDAREAVALYDRAAALAPDDPAPAWAAIELLIGSASEEGVEQRVRRLLGAHGYHAQAANLLARRLLARDADLERARELAQRAVRFGGGSEALETLGRIELERGNAERAVELLKRSLETRSGDPSLRYALGRALVRDGKTEAARRELQKAIDGGSFPEREEARAELARLSAI